MKPTPETAPALLVQLCKKLERERDESRASNAELLERLRERTESHLAASARDVHDNQRLRVEKDAMREAISVFCNDQGWASDEWKKQPHIAPLFKIASFQPFSE